MHDILSRIYESKARATRSEEAIEPYERVREIALRRRGERRCLRDALLSAREPAIIGEIKRASPSAGLIARNFDPSAIARTYDAAGVDALSVLTEADHFLGELGFLDAARAQTSRPILRKDFLTTRYQVAQSAAHGADAILLIVAGLTDALMHDALDEASRFDLDVLVEVHDLSELQRAIEFGVVLVGINNRDLRTFDTDLGVTEYLVPSVPSGVFAVSESGMRGPEDIARLHAAGARGFLVGETLMRSEDPAATIAALKKSLTLK